MPQAPDLSELCRVSARIGADPLLVQGPGGNTSLKMEGALWVKASGTWLTEAITKPIFAGLSLAMVNQLKASGSTGDFSDALLPDSHPGLRPSIETALHALMPQPAVIHAHAANSMAVSVLDEGEAQAARALADLDWVWIPYARPGHDLAAAVENALARKSADILLLQNHGVVIGADSPPAAEALLREVELRLSLPLRDFPQADPAIARSRESERHEALVDLAALATDPFLLGVATHAPLFPDQIVFLGGAVPSVAEDESLKAAAERVMDATGIPPALLIWPDIGVFADRARTSAASALIAGLFEVVRRIPDGAPVRSLGAQDVADLLGWEAEAYRIGLAAKDPK